MYILTLAVRTTFDCWMRHTAFATSGSSNKAFVSVYLRLKLFWWCMINRKPCQYLLISSSLSSTRHSDWLSKPRHFYAVSGLAWSILYQKTQKALTWYFLYIYYFVPFFFFFFFLLRQDFINYQWHTSACNYNFLNLLSLCFHSPNDVLPRTSAERIHSRGTGRRASIQNFLNFGIWQLL